MALRLAVAITGEAGGLREGMQTAGRELDRLAERGERAARRLAEGLDRAGRRMQAIGQRLTLAITAPLVAIGTVAVRAFDVQIQAERRLAAAIRATGEEAAGQLSIFKEIASTLQSVTTVGDEATLANIQVARSMGLNAEQSARAARNAIALSAAFGINEQSAIRYTAALEQGDTTMLNRYIPTLRNLEDENERAAEAQRILADAFQVATESARVGLGPFRQLMNSIGDLAEQFGAIILEGINPFIQRARALVDWLQKLDEGTKRAIVGIAAFLAAMGPGLVIMGLFTRGLGLMLSGFIIFSRGFIRVARAVIVEIGLLGAAFATPVGAAIAMSTAVVAAAVGLRDTLAQIWQEIVNAARDWLIEQWNSRVLEPFVENVNRVRTAVGLEPIELPPLITTGEAERAIEEIDGQLERLRAKLREVQEDLRAAGDDEDRAAFFSLIGEGIVLDIQELERRRQALAGVLPEGGAPTGTPSSRIAAAFERDMNRIRGEFQGVLDGIRAQLPDGLFDALFGDLDTVTPDIEEAERRLAELMAQLPAGGLPGALAGEGGDGGGAATLEELKQKLAELGGEVGKLPGQIEGVRDEIAELGRDVAEGITGPLKDALRSGEQGFAGFRDAGMRIMSNLRDRLLEQIFKPIEDAIAKLFDAGSAGGGGGGGGGGILGGIFGAIGSAIGGLFGGGSTGASTGSAQFLPGVGGRVPFGFAAGGAFDARGIVPFAKGGAFDPLGEVLTRPTLFRFADGAGFRAGVAGEAGQEAILPLRRGAGGRLGVEAAGLGRPAVVNIAGDTIVLQDSQTRPEELKRILATRDEKLKREVLELVQDAWVANPNSFPGS